MIELFSKALGLEKQPVPLVWFLFTVSILHVGAFIVWIHLLKNSWKQRKFTSEVRMTVMVVCVLVCASVWMVDLRWSPRCYLSGFS